PWVIMGGEEPRVNRHFASDPCHLPLRDFPIFTWRKPVIHGADKVHKPLCGPLFPGLPEVCIFTPWAARLPCQAIAVGVIIPDGSREPFPTSKLVNGSTHSWHRSGAHFCPEGMPRGSVPRANFPGHLSPRPVKGHWDTI